MSLARRFFRATAVALFVIALFGAFSGPAGAQQSSTLRAPAFQVDPAWPGIPDNWVLGEGIGELGIRN